MTDTSTASGFDFGAAASGDAYHPPINETLPKGNYVVEVQYLENTTSSGGFPMLKLTLVCDEGINWDNIVISPNDFSVQKLMGFIDSAGVPRPDPAQGEISAQDGRLSEAYVAKLTHAQVGVLIRDEDDNRPDHRGETRPRPKGYVPVDKLAGKTGPIGTPAGSNDSGAAATQAADDIPF